MFLRSQFHIRINWQRLNFHLNAIAVLRATSGGEYCNKTAFKGGALSQEWPLLRPLITNWPLTGWQTLVRQPQISSFPWVSRHDSVQFSVHWLQQQYMTVHCVNSFTEIPGNGLRSFRYKVVSIQVDSIQIEVVSRHQQSWFDSSGIHEVNPHKQRCGRLASKTE